MSTDKVLLVSYPHSGSNWVRYCIEYFSGMRTPGSKRHPLVRTGPTIIDRTHFLDKRHRRSFVRARRDPADWDDGKKSKVWLRRALSELKKERRVRDIINNRRVILLVRAPNESYCRNQLRFHEGLVGYLGNIRIFDACRRDKLLIYYEDLVGDFDEMGRILDFVGVRYDLSDFDLDHHRNKSLGLYSTGPYQAQSKDDLYNFSFHSGELSGDMKSAIRAYAVSYLGQDLYDKYLSRFDPADEPVTFSRPDQAPVVGREVGAG